jgi:hypothetical protein
MDNDLFAIYTDPKNSGSFGGVDKLLRAAKAADLPVTRKQVQEFLTSVYAYSLTKPKKYKFKRTKVIASSINDLHMADLADMRHLSKQNDGIKFLLVIIDFFRKYLWVVPLENKTAAVTRDGFMQVYSDPANRPRYLQTDFGKEFWGGPVQKLFRELNIRHYSVPSTVKASLAERSIRILKNLCSRWMLHNLTQRYIDVLSSIVENINNSKSRVTKFAPAEIDELNSDQVFKNLYPELWETKVEPKEKPTFSIGDSVRLAKEKTPFQKGYHITWTPEIFTVYEIINNKPLLYRVKDSKGKAIIGSFYKEELAKVVNAENVYLIEKTIKTRHATKNRPKQYFVKWLGFPDKENTWISEEDWIAHL